MGPARAGLVRDALGTLAVLGTVAFAAVGLPLIDHSLPEYRSVSADVPYPVGGGVTVQPPAYASIDLTRTRPGRDRGTALIRTGDTRLVVVVTPYRDSLDHAAERLRRKIGRTGGVPEGEEQPASTAAGIEGRAGAYRSNERPGPDERPGTYVVFVHAGRAVELTVTGPQSATQAEAVARGLTIETGSGP